MQYVKCRDMDPLGTTVKPVLKENTLKERSREFYARYRKEKIIATYNWNTYIMPEHANTANLIFQTKCAITFAYVSYVSTDLTEERKILTSQQSFEKLLQDILSH